MAGPRSKEQQLRAFYRVLAEAWGPQHWWPARTRLEMIAGAYLTQNTAWSNVERALANLRRARLLTVDALRRVSLPELEQLIRPAGYFRQKARRLKTFLAFLDAHYHGSLRRMLAQPTAQLRQELLALNGVGPETADSILLYAGNHSIFVVDAYTRRILHRHGILPATAEYDEIRTLCERALRTLHSRRPQERRETKRKTASAPQHAERETRRGLRGAAHPPSAMSTAERSPLAQTYNEMHALLVGVGKNYCLKAAAKCAACPLQGLLGQL
jgi:endonuclease-3 related protein